MKKDVNVLLLILGAIGLFYASIITYKSIGRAPSTQRAVSTRTQSDLIELRGDELVTIELDDTWKGVINLNPDKQVIGTIITESVHWQVRVDKRGDQVFNLFPSEWKKGSTLKIVDGNINEWRVNPEKNPGKKATLIARLAPRDTIK